MTSGANVLNEFKYSANAYKRMDKLDSDLAEWKVSPIS